MTVVARVGLYILFLIAYVIWSIGLFIVVVKRVGANARRQRTQQFMLSQALLFMSIGGLMVYLYLLSGYFSVFLLLVLLTGMEVAAIIGAGLRGLSGNGDAAPRSSLATATLDFDVRYPTLAKTVTSLLPTVIMAAYPVVCGVLFFWLPRPALPTRILQATMLYYLVLSGLNAIRTAITVSSENLDEPARQTALLNGTAELVPVMLFLSITFWAFGVGTEGHRVLVGDTSLVVTPLVFVAIAAYFLVFALLPYVAGTQRGKRKLRLFLDERNSWYDRLHDVLIMPTPKLHERKLVGFEAEVRGSRDAFVNENPVLLLDARLRAQGAKQDVQEAMDDMPELHASISMRRPTLPALPEALRRWTKLLDHAGVEGENADDFQRFLVASMIDSRAVDPRFKHLHWFDGLLEEIEEARRSMRRQRTLQDKEAAAATWAQAYRVRAEQITAQIKEIQHTRAPIIVGASAIIGPLGTVILDQFGSFAWQTFSRGIAS